MWNKRVVAGFFFFFFFFCLFVFLFIIPLEICVFHYFIILYFRTINYSKYFVVLYSIKFIRMI